ncbi:aldo/keto reductase [Candidatus Kaiserbacteria bacterium]|nr:aldo/keto reductase [Candidatus Kaiserbacteria bacterium]
MDPVRSHTAKSRLILGTAGIGMPYGVSNTEGQPSKEKAFEIFDAAFACGITTFDTASAYGEAEEILGQWMQRSHHVVSVITKMKPYEADHGSGFVVAQIEASLERLHLDVLDGYLLHAARDIYVPAVLEGLQSAKERGLVRNVGASVYDEGEAYDALSTGVDYIQVPYNVFDQRFGRNEFLEKALARKVTVFARSPFLQGLLLMELTQLPPSLSSARPYLERFIAVASRHGLSRVEAALGFVLAEEQIPHIIVGAVSAAQVRELSSAGVLSYDVVAEMRELFKDVPDEVRDPRLWTNVA